MSHRACAAVSVPLLVLSVLLLGAGGASGYRFHRAIEASPGWNELELPDDVFSEARVGLPDLRIVAEPGGEIPYAIDPVLPRIARRLVLFDIEQKPNLETTAIADRGDDPGWTDLVEFQVPEREFIKPIVLEASSDRKKWSEFARGSIFATASGARMTKIRFAPNDRRYFRVRADDRNGPPIDLTHATTAQSLKEPTLRLVDASVKQEADAEVSVSTYAVALASDRLPVVEIRVEASNAAYARKASVFERVWFRDEVSRRLLGQGKLVRSADGVTTTSIPVAPPLGRNIELDIERSGGVPLHVSSVVAAVEPRVLRFHAPLDSHLELHYGSAVAVGPAYDVGWALGAGRPARFAPANLGPPIDTGAPTPPALEVPRGAALEPSAWKLRRPIQLPPRGPVAYLDLDRGDGPLADVRIVDQRNRQVPYLVEAKPRHSRAPLDFRAEHRNGQTILRLDGLDVQKSADAIEVEIASPAYFSRELTVVEEMSDQRGKAGERHIGSLSAVRAADDPVAPLRVAITRPASSRLVVRIDDRDNAPLAVSNVYVDYARRRVDFVWTPDDHLTLLADNRTAGSPHYDLALVADRVLSSPAEAATLGAPMDGEPRAPKTPFWFWFFVAGAALVLVFAVGQVVAREPAREDRDRV